MRRCRDEPRLSRIWGPCMEVIDLPWTLNISIGPHYSRQLAWILAPSVALWYLGDEDKLAGFNGSSYDQKLLPHTSGHAMTDIPQVLTFNS